MSVIVVLSLVLLLATLGVVGVVVVHLLRSVRRLRSAVGTAVQRLGPLTEELQAETAVTSLETGALQRSLAELASARSDRRGIPRTTATTEAP